MKEKPLLALNLAWAGLAIGAFLGGSMVTNKQMSRGDANDTPVEDARPRRPLAPGPGGSARLNAGEEANPGRGAQGTTYPADDATLRKEYFKQVVGLSEKEFSDLVKKDFNKAERVLAMVEDPWTRNLFGSCIIKDLIARDLDAAISFAAPGSFRSASGELAAAVYKQRGTDALLTWIDAIEPGEKDKSDDQSIYKAKASQAALEIVARENPDRARQWVVTNAGTPHVDGYTLFRIAGAMGSDPVLQIKWLDELPIAEEMRAGAIGRVFEGYARDDLYAASQWLAEQELTPMHDRAIYEFAFHAKAIDPEGATMWAEQITDGALRKQILDNIRKYRLYLEKKK